MPVVLVLTSSAIRAVDLIRYAILSNQVTRTTIRTVELSFALHTQFVTRAASELQKQTKVAKLFAKHIKMEEQVVFLKNTLVNVAVGTPGRILKLLEETGEYRSIDITPYWLHSVSYVPTTPS